MTKQQAKERIEKLKKEINHHRYLYHVLDRTEISDAALDSLKKELFDLEEQFPELLTSDSPTQRVGGKPLKEFKKVRHETPMLSFNDAFSEEDMHAWLTRVENYLHAKRRAENIHKNPPSNLRESAAPEFYCELKIDGLAIELIYEDGVLVRGSTRGDGEIGEDVTQNLKTAEAIPLQLYEVEPRKSLTRLNLVRTVPRRLVVRGEIFLTKKEFARINRGLEQKGQKLYANPRNLAAGTIRQLDPKITASRKLDSFQYAIVTDLGQKRHSDEHEMLHDLGFKINKHNRVCNGLKEVIEFRDYWEKHRENLPYEVDGVVIILNDNKIFNEAGVIGKAPRAAIAYKFSPKEATTAVLNIKVQIGRTGVLTPVAEMRPVSVGGVTISHASLHNMDEIGRLGLKIGDTVIVSRAGDVIPQITNVLKNLRTGKEKAFHMPEKCPVDGSKVVRDDGGVAYRCSNKTCGARNREGLSHFVSRAAFNIEGLGPKIIDRFLDEGLITDAADIFNLKEGDIAVLERFGEKSAKNIVLEIEENKKVTLPRFLYALGILHVGEETSELLAKQAILKIKNQKSTHSTSSGLILSKAEGSKIKILDVLKFFQNTSEEDLQQIPDIGPKMAESIYGWFREKRNIHLLKKLDRASVRIESYKLQTTNYKLRGIIFVLTGTLESMSRGEAKEKIRALGGDVNESVSKKTTYVVVGAEPGSKAEKAKRLGVKIIDEKEFLKLIQ